MRGPSSGCIKTLKKQCLQFTADSSKLFFYREFWGIFSCQGLQSSKMVHVAYFRGEGVTWRAIFLF